MFDIDYFKRFNDQYGHSVGDDALQNVAQTIQKLLKRSGDALFRLGGEEFGVLFTANSEAKASHFAEKMCKSIYQLKIPHEASPHGVLTASFGVTYWNTNEIISAERVYSDTDSALYTAKGLGRNTVYMKKKCPMGADN
jgi:diguanylate cyclase (GGDEF)-like protein